MRVEWWLFSGEERYKKEAEGIDIGSVSSAQGVISHDASTANQGSD